MEIRLSLIIPVFNRPDEIRELLESLLEQRFQGMYEVVIIEDGSTQDSAEVVNQFSDALQITYFSKSNTGPGDSRNYGMHRAEGNYYIVLDSDCILPPNYLEEVVHELNRDFVHCFGGPDAADVSFSKVQKAINYTMTSFWTTGGIRGGKHSVDKFQPRSFNMGISQEAFEKTGGFGQIHPGEDPDLTFRIWQAGFKTRLFQNAFVYHKRRINWNTFYNQVHKFGLVRPILNKWHPKTARFTYWFPSLFLAGLLVSIVLLFNDVAVPIVGYLIYFLLLFVDSLVRNKDFIVALLSVFAALVQFFGYGSGFLKSTLLINFSDKEPDKLFPKLFFKQG